MKKIHFENLSTQKFWIILMVLSLIFILLGLFEPFEIENPKVYKFFSLFGFLTQALFYSRLFWYKYNVQWNKKGIVLRIKPYFGKSISFEEIKSVELIENAMVLKKSNQQELRFDLAEIIVTDRQKLFNLIKECANLD